MEALVMGASANSVGAFPFSHACGKRRHSQQGVDCFELTEARYSAEGDKSVAAAAAAAAAASVTAAAVTAVVEDSVPWRWLWLLHPNSSIAAVMSAAFFAFLPRQQHLPTQQRL